MSNSARDLAAARAELPTLQRSPGASGRKAVVALITADDLLWSRIGAAAGARCHLKQFDSIAAALADDAPRTVSVFLWDVRGQTNVVGEMAKLQRHRDSSTIVVIDTAADSARWKAHLRTNQVSGSIDETAADVQITDTLIRAIEESQARSLLSAGNENESSPALAGSSTYSRRGLPFILGVTAFLILMALAAVYLLRPKHGPTPARMPAPTVRDGAARPPSPIAVPDADGVQAIESVLEQARQAMLERRYVEPVEDNALALYRRALALDANNGEAKQGVDRLLDLLLDRAESALGSRQFDQALQAMEGARSLRPGNERLASLDARVTALRGDLGPRQVQMAILAQNFDRASKLVEEGVNSRALTAAQAVSLRDLLKNQRSEFEVTKNVRLAQTRLQQNRLLDPANDCAMAYWNRARQAGAPALVVPLTRELIVRFIDAGRAAVEQRKFGDAERMIAAARLASAPPVLVQALQHDLSSAREQNARETAAQSAAQEAARTANVIQTEPPGGAPMRELPPLVLIAPLNPIYPREADKNGTEGWVDITFNVRADGKTSDIRIVDSSPKRIFNDAAVDAVRRARYKPLPQNDPSTPRKVRVRLSFREQQ